MYYTDNHVHSFCSPDGCDSMTDMMLATYAKGVRHMCFTDHCDMDDFQTGKPDPDCFAFRDKMLRQYDEALSKKPEDMTVCLGLELGEINHNPGLATEIAASPELDFVLGSLHNLRGTVDFYVMSYPDEAFCKKILDGYVKELAEMAQMKCFDVMAHIGYPVRYFRRAGFTLPNLTTESYHDELEALLKTLIENGKGIEINCAGYRNSYLGDSVPTIDILRMYKDLGGEIITVGSDAHETAHAGAHIDNGFDILGTLGYKYVAVFEKREPKFIKID